jgi:adenine phosphoribosyltransferase
MAGAAAIDVARSAFLEQFCWRDGHADVWASFADARTLRVLVEGLAAPWLGRGVTRVVGLESRGFLLGGAVAVQLGVGFVAVRKPGGLLPGTKLTTKARADYRGLSHELRMQAVLSPDDVVLLVDDWAERGSQAAAVRELIELSGATFAGLSILVDQLEDTVRVRLGRVTSLVKAAELGDSS